MYFYIFFVRIFLICLLCVFVLLFAFSAVLSSFSFLLTLLISFVVVSVSFICSLYSIFLSCCLVFVVVISSCALFVFCLVSLSLFVCFTHPLRRTQQRCVAGTPRPARPIAIDWVNGLFRSWTSAQAAVLVVTVGGPNGYTSTGRSRRPTSSSISSAIPVARIYQARRGRCAKMSQGGLPPKHAHSANSFSAATIATRCSRSGGPRAPVDAQNRTQGTRPDSVRTAASPRQKTKRRSLFSGTGGGRANVVRG